ncbi:MAG: ferredoxin family protein [Rhodospirillales bacterium]|nr:ferredoxin family protein [Rhodospirillales bacterium]
MPPKVDYDKCDGCRICVELCSEDVFFGTPGLGAKKESPAVVSHPGLCWHCNWCVDLCPTDAIWLNIPLTMHIPYK